jgi:hypothetical protein
MSWALHRLWLLLNPPHGPIRYDEYINSVAWERRRRAYFRSHARRCAACGTRRGVIDLHHRTYDRLGREPDMDLVPLCRDDHDLVHNIHRRNPARPLDDVTSEVIIRQRRAL